MRYETPWEDRSFSGRARGGRGLHEDEPAEVQIGVDDEDLYEPGKVRVALAGWNSGDVWYEEHLPIEDVERLSMAIRCGSEETFRFGGLILQSRPGNLGWTIRTEAHGFVSLNAPQGLRIAYALADRVHAIAEMEKANG